MKRLHKDGQLAPEVRIRINSMVPKGRPENELVHVVLTSPDDFWDMYVTEVRPTSGGDFLLRGFSFFNGGANAPERKLSELKNCAIEFNPDFLTKPEDERYIHQLLNTGHYEPVKAVAAQA